MAQEDRNGATTTPPSPPPQLQEVLDAALAAQAAAEAAAAAAANTPVAAPTHAATSKATPVDADELPLIDSEASFGLKRLTWANLKITLSSLWQRQIYSAFTSTGTAPTFVVTPVPSIGSYGVNARLLVRIHSASLSVAATLNANGLGARSIVQYDSIGNKVTPYLPAGFRADVVDDGTDWVVINAVPSPVTAVNVRQSIQYGPITSGIADLITQAQVGATLASGVTLGANFFASVGNGFNSDGSQRNVNRIRASTLNIPNLTASVTNYIWYDTSTDTAGFVTVADAFQYGGTIPVTNNQYTYDYLNHVMYLGNGTTASQSNRLIVAEVDTNGTVVTAIRVRPYVGFYDSGYTATLVAANGSYSRNHNFGTKEISVNEAIECTTADQGFAVGDVLNNVGGNTSVWGMPASISVRANNLTVKRPVTVAYVVANNSTGSNGTLTAASWRYKTVCRRLF